MIGPTSIVIPAYNEAATIRDIAQRALQQCPRVIVVDDGSGDETVAQLADLPLTLLRHKQNMGKAASLWDGMQEALRQGSRYIVTLDGDGQHAPEDIPLLEKAAAGQPDSLIIAARKKSLEQAPRARLFANRFADFWISWAAGRRIEDSQSGFRLYPATALERLHIPVHRARGFVFESEIIIEAVRAGFACCAVPIAASYPTHARASHFRPVADITRIVAMVAWKLIKWGMYPAGLYRAYLKPR